MNLWNRAKHCYQLIWTLSIIAVALSSDNAPKSSNNIHESSGSVSQLLERHLTNLSWSQHNVTVSFGSSLSEPAGDSFVISYQLLYEDSRIIVKAIDIPDRYSFVSQDNISHVLGSSAEIYVYPEVEFSTLVQERGSLHCIIGWEEKINNGKSELTGVNHNRDCGFTSNDRNFYQLRPAISFARVVETTPQYFALDASLEHRKNQAPLIETHLAKDLKEQDEWPFSPWKSVSILATIPTINSSGIHLNLIFHYRYSNLLRNVEGWIENCPDGLLYSISFSNLRERHAHMVHVDPKLSFQYQSYVFGSIKTAFEMSWKASFTAFDNQLERKEATIRGFYEIAGRPERLDINADFSSIRVESMSNPIPRQNNDVDKDWFVSPKKTVRVTAELQRDVGRPEYVSFRISYFFNSSSFRCFGGPIGAFPKGATFTWKHLVVDMREGNTLHAFPRIGFTYPLQTGSIHHDWLTVDFSWGEYFEEPVYAAQYTSGLTGRVELISATWMKGHQANPLTVENITMYVSQWWDGQPQSAKRSAQLNAFLSPKHHAQISASLHFGSEVEKRATSFSWTIDYHYSHDIQEVIGESDNLTGGALFNITYVLLDRQSGTFFHGKIGGLYEHPMANGSTLYISLEWGAWFSSMTNELDGEIHPQRAWIVKGGLRQDIDVSSLNLAIMPLDKAPEIPERERIDVRSIPTSGDSNSEKSRRARTLTPRTIAGSNDHW